MKRIYKNHDIAFNLAVNNFPINFKLIKSIDFKFYTTSPLVFFTKSDKDINKQNTIIITSQDLDKLNEGVLYYDYKVVLVDSVMPDQTFDTVNTIMTAYYLANGNHFDEPIPESDIRWGKINGNIENQKDLMAKFGDYYTIDAIDQQIENLVAGDINLKNYYTKNDIDAKGYLTEHQDITGKLDVSAYNTDMQDVAMKTDLDAYVTTTELVGKHYLTEHQNINHLATKSELSNYQPVGNYLTQAQLDGKGYLTEHQSLVDYATKDYVNNVITSTTIDLTDYYKKSETYSKNEIDNKGYLTQHQSLVNYALKGDIPTTVSAFKNDKGYLTEHQSLVNYFTKDEVIAEIDKHIVGDTATLANYYTKNETYNKQEVDDAIVRGAAGVDLTQYYTKNDIDGKGYLTEHQNINHLATKSELANYQKVGNYITQKQLDAKGYLTEHQSLVDYAKKTDIPSLDGYATQTYVNQQVNNAITGSTQIDLSNYYTIQQIDNKGYLTEVPQEYVTESELIAKGYLTEHQSLADYAKKTDIPSLNGYATEQYVNQQIDAKITAGTEVNLDNYYKKSETYSQQEIDNKGYLTTIPEEYVTDSELSQKGYLTSSDMSLNGYAKVVECTQSEYDGMVKDAYTLYVITDADPVDVYSKSDVDALILDLNNKILALQK